MEITEALVAKLIEDGIGPEDARTHVDRVMAGVEAAFVAAMSTLDGHVGALPAYQRMSGRDLSLQLLLGLFSGASEELREGLPPGTQYINIELETPTCVKN